MKRKMMSMSALMAACALALTGCGGGGSTDAGAAKTDAEGPVRMWVMEGSFSDETQKAMIDKFEKDNPGSKLKIEVQQWDGIVSKLQTSLASDNESPDLVELGNNQTATFTAVNAFAKLTDMYEEMGGKKLIQSFIDAAKLGDDVYAFPLYAGARGVYYRTDLFEQAGIAVPQTIDEFTDAVIKLQEANPEKKDNFSGMYMAAVDIHGVESYLFANGFDYAEQEGGKWVGKVSSPESIKALTNLKRIFDNGTKFAGDSQASQKSFERLFSSGEAGVLIGTGNIGTKIDKKLWDENKIGVIAIPSDKPGVPGKTFAGGSSIAMAAKAPHPEAAKKLLKTIFSEDIQKAIAVNDGWVPGNSDYGKDAKSPLGDKAAEIVGNSKLTPNSAEWGVNFSGAELSEFYGRIAKGEDIAKVAQEYNDRIEKVLNK